MHILTDETNEENTLRLLAKKPYLVCCLKYLGFFSSVMKQKYSGFFLFILFLFR